MRIAAIALMLLGAATVSAVTTVTTTIKPAGQGGDYTTLSAWEAGQQADLPALDEIRVGSIDGDWSAGPDTAAVTIDGWTTDATRYIEIRTTTAARHPGKWDATKYVLSQSGAVAPITISESYVKCIGIQFYCATGRPINGQNAVMFFGDKLICKTLSANLGSRFTSGELRNCAFIGSGSETSAAVLLNTAAVTLNVYNCTIYGAVIGFAETQGTMNLSNCLYQSGGVASPDGYNSISGTCVNNCSDIASDAPGTNPQTGTITFTDAANGDFGLVAGVAIANGADLSATFTDDLAGLTRTVPWDIGARKYVAAAPAVTQFEDVFERP